MLTKSHKKEKIKKQKNPKKGKRKITKIKNPNKLKKRVKKVYNCFRKKKMNLPWLPTKKINKIAKLFKMIMEILIIKKMTFKIIKKMTFKINLMT